MKTPQEKLLPIYLHELYSLAVAVLKNCDEVFSLAPVHPADGGFRIAVSPDLHAKIAAALLASSNFRKLVRTNQKRGKKESDERFKFRLERAAALAGLFEGLDLKTMLDAKVRNTLEHFDEYLDDFVRSVAAPSDTPRTIAVNVAFSADGAVARAIFPLRLYVTSTHRFSNFDFSVDLNRLRAEAASVTERLRALPAFQETGTDPGGAIVVLPATT
jgi:hypothetical protein